MREHTEPLGVLSTVISDAQAALTAGSEGLAGKAA